jgi:U3 small nucleolar RNA-associated protein 19
MNKHADSEHPNLAVNLLAILERLTTFPTEPNELNAWWIVEFGTKPPKPKNLKNGTKEPDSSSDEDDLGRGVGVEDDDDWRKFFDEEKKVENGAEQAAWDSVAKDDHTPISALSLVS